MSEPFNVNQYWLDRGRTYAGEERLALEYHRVQEKHILQTLGDAGLGVERILELGCGFGRVTRLLAERFPASRITALDLSPDQLANARRYCEGCDSISFQTYDFYRGEPFPGGSHDIALAIEVFLHHPPEIIRGLLERLHQTVPVIVHLDWFESWSGPLPPHVWIHDYPTYHRALGWEVAALPVPVRVEGKQQVLFIAAERLPESIHSRNAVDYPLEADETLGSWEHRVAQATSDLSSVIPPGGVFILVDGDEWGVRSFAEQRRAVPFLEKDGQYWGPPPDDVSAWEALNQARAGGAGWLVIGWNAFWWLEHYRDWYRRLCREYECLLTNERVVIFKLKL